MMAYIVRLDKRNTHGWQVRGGGKRGYHSKMFSDGRYGGKEAARAVVQAYLAEYRATHPDDSARPYPHGFHEGKMLANNKSGLTLPTAKAGGF